MQQVDGTLSSIELQREALEGANTYSAIMTAMKTASGALKMANNNMDVDQVHDVMDEIAEQQSVSDEISKAISSSLGIGGDIDEDELEAELESLEQEELDKDLLNIKPTTIRLPDVPSIEIKEKKNSKCSMKPN